MSSRVTASLLALIFIFSASFVATRISDGIDTNILSLLPGDGHDPVLADAMQRASLDASNRIAFAIEGGKAQQRSDAARDLAKALEATGFFRPSSADAKDLWVWLHAHRATLLCPADREKLLAGQGAAIAQSALLEWFAPVTMTGRDALANDPLLLTGRLLNCLVPASLTSAPPANAALVSGSLTASVFRLDVQDKINVVIAKWHDGASAQGLVLNRAGAVFHAAYGAEHARTEMSMIGGITTIAVILFYWLMFRSLRAPLIAACMVVFSLTIGLAATLAIFGSIHVMAMVFGAALIGMVVDYTTYFLVTGLTGDGQSGDARKALIFRPLTLGMATSVAAFAALLFFPVTAFREIAVFGGVGLVAAWIATLGLTPILEGGAMQAGPGARFVKRRADRFLAQNVSPRGGIIILACALMVLVAGWLHGRTLDDVRRFQAPSPVLVAEEARVRALVGFAPVSSFFLFRDVSRDAVTEREQHALNNLEAAGKGASVAWASSRFDPPAVTTKNDAIVIRTDLLKPHLGSVLKSLGGGNAHAYDEAAQKLDDAPPSLPAFLSSLRGNTGNVYWSIVPISGNVDGAGVPADELIEPATRYSQLLARYRVLASIGLVGAVLATGLMLVAYYRSLACVRILLPTMLALVATPALLALFGVPYSFFSAMGLFLVAGAGVDYAIFQWEKPGKAGDWTRVGIVLAATMTCISVGLLGLSSVLPVKSFGLTVATGVVLSLLASPLVRGWSGNKRPEGEQ